jgi:hypothetical protein
MNASKLNVQIDNNRKYYQEYRLNNPESIKLAREKWNKDNKQYYINYNINNKDKINERRRELRKEQKRLKDNS